MARPKPLIAFISDFGVQDPYVGVVHGVVERLSNGRVRVIDVSHEVPSFNITAGSYILYTSYRYFPEGTVFLVVVDPGVGGKRRALVVETRNYFFVGPDNGVLWQAVVEDGILSAWSIENEAIMLRPVSASFHGRDVFAPAAVHVALGGNLESLGPRIDPESLVRLELLQPCSKPPLEARVVYIDRFGNAALGLRGEECFKTICGGLTRVCSGKGCYSVRCRRVFSEAEPGELILYINSFGFLELAVNLGSAADRLGVRIGDTVRLM